MEILICYNYGEMLIAFQFIAFYVQNGRVVGVSTMQHDPHVTKSAELFRLGLMPSPEELRAGKVRKYTPSIELADWGRRTF